MLHSLTPARDLVTTAFERILTWCYPPACPGCQVAVPSLDTFCRRCESALPWLAPPYCSVCGIPVQGVAGICGACQSRNPAFRAGRSGLALGWPLHDALVRWKYRGLTGYTPLFRRLMRATAGRLPLDRYARLDALIPVPLHPKRLAWRGFNQGTELALACAQTWELPVWQGALLRTRETPPQQKQANDAARWRNLEGAFAVPDPGLVRGRAVCLVDDVATTGATLHACAVALKGAGARTVTYVTLARQTLTPATGRTGN
ncbi:MAG: ComF family protein [bacterium]